MSALTSDDVRSQQFNQPSRGRKGYAEGEVDTFLDAVVAALDARDAEIADLKARLVLDQRTAPANLTGASPAEPPASEAAAGLLALAQRTAEEHVATAEHQAAELVTDAQREATGTKVQAQAQAQHVLEEAQTERRRLLGALHFEPAEISEAISVLRGTGERHLEAYVMGVLAEARRLAVPERLADVTALSA